MSLWVPITGIILVMLSPFIILFIYYYLSYLLFRWKLERAVKRKDYDAVIAMVDKKV